MRATLDVHFEVQCGGDVNLSDEQLLSSIISLLQSRSMETYDSSRAFKCLCERRRRHLSDLDSGSSIGQPMLWDDSGDLFDVDSDDFVSSVGYPML